MYLAVWMAFASPARSADEGAFINAGVGIVDITPTGEVTLAGSPSPKKTSEVRTRLYVRALVLSAGNTKAAIVTLDTLKHPVDLAMSARAKIEQITGIPASHVVICSSHTHSGPLWSCYPDKLVTPIAEAVARAAKDLMPCTLGAAKGKAEGVAECRRVIKNGNAWNRWQLKPGEADMYPAEGPVDPEFDLLALTGTDGKPRAVVYNFACHAANNRAPLISADYPGDVEIFVQKQLERTFPTQECVKQLPDPGHPHQRAECRLLTQRFINSFSTRIFDQMFSFAALQSGPISQSAEITFTLPL